MSSNEQMSKGVEDGIVEQPGGSRRVRSLDDLSSGFVTTDLSEAIERIARRREAYPDGDWVVNVSNASRMLTRGLLPPPPAPPRDLLGIPDTRTPASVQRGAFRGQAREARGSQTPRSGQGRPGQDRPGQDRRGWQVQGYDGEEAPETLDDDVISVDNVDADHDLFGAREEPAPPRPSTSAARHVRLGRMVQSHRVNLRRMP